MRLQFLFAGILICTGFFTAHAQCPVNIDFEQGTFNGWTCYTGYVSDDNGTNVISISPSGGPVYNRHTMYNPGAGVDPYGGFPINCPNGSNHSIRLGNDLGGGEAEGVSYEFTIPAGRDVYNLIYHYAVVFQDPDHLPEQQPRMEIEITDVTDDQLISCSSFTFHPEGSVLPGFTLSDNPGSSTPVWCKDWSAVSISLDNHAGKTIRLFFKTADCTFKKHFGYAYIDVNSECSGEFVGATYCPDDTIVNVLAPFGYQSYTWYNKDFSQVLGSQQQLTLKPPPSTGSEVAVTLVPFDGYGCLDTLYAELVDTLHITAHAGNDTLSCNHSPVQLGVLPQPGLVYHWEPSAGLSDPTIANPIASPDTTTMYIESVRNNGGGCLNMDTVVVKAASVNNSMQVNGSADYCYNSGDSSILQVQPASTIQWFQDGILVPGANQPYFKVTQSGTYFAMLVDITGCVLYTKKEDVLIDTPRLGVTYPVVYAVVNDPLTLQARPFGQTVLWQPPAHLDNPASPTPVFKSNTEQLYTVAITTASGCTTIDTQLVKTISSVKIYVPNAFTPNSDGHNDYLHPIMFGVKQLHYFKVFNRLGELMYEMDNIEMPGWNGVWKGQAQTTQTVVWVMEALGLDGSIYIRRGASVLIR